MVSVVRRGWAYDLSALPATADIARMRFGVALLNGNSIRVTGASAGTRGECFWCRKMLYICVFNAANYLVPHVRFVVRTRVMCQAGRARATYENGDIVAWLCERAPLWVVVHVCALLRDC
jgi:hypothetical protein